MHKTNNLHLARGVISLKGLFLIATVLACPILLVGCGYRARALPMPKINGSASAAAALERYDADGDGLLGKKEILDCIGLADNLAVFDVNGDSSISEDELSSGLESITGDGFSLLGAPCAFILDGRPLRNAKVSLEPVDYLVSDLSKATATTNGSGDCYPIIDPASLPKEFSRMRGMQPGLYKIVVTHDEIPIPAKYNENTTLGVLVSNASLPRDGFVFKLSTK